jgi:hypothetical protein
VNATLLNPAHGLTVATLRANMIATLTALIEDSSLPD